MRRAAACLARVTARPVGVWVLLAGACMTLGFAPFGLWPIAVGSLAVLWVLVRHAASARQALGAALVWGMGHGVTALYWLPWAFYKDADNSLLAAIAGGVPAMLGVAFYGALGVALVCVLAWVTGQRHGWNVAAVVWVGLWVLVEFVKGLHPMGFPWLPVGAVFARSVPMMQLAALAGVWGLSLLALALAVLVSRGTRRGVTAAAVLVLAVIAGGAWRVHTAPGDAGTTMVRVVQPNIQSPHKWDAEKRWEFLKETMQVALAQEPVPPTVVMPETAVAFYLDEEDDVRRAVAGRFAEAAPAGSALVTGTVRREEDPETFLFKYYNSLAVLGGDGAVREAYDKRLLVPFGEYIPLRSWLEKLPLPGPVRTLSQSRLDYSAGTRPPLFATPAGPAVGLICYEGIFPLPVLHAAREARYLINVTNDNWFTGTIALYQHAALARLRAVESGVPLVRVANTGLTVVYDAYGRVVLRLPINMAMAQDVALPPVAPRTPLMRLLGN